MTFKKQIRLAGSFLTLAIFMTFTLSGCGESSDENNYSIVHSYSGYKGASYEKIISELRQLQVENPDMVEVVTYGKTLGSRELVLVRISGSKRGAGLERPAVLMTQAIHGNEYQKLADPVPYEFVRNMGRHENFAKFLSAGGILYVVPVTNPDGYENGRRGNASGYDLNRDWPLRRAGKEGFSQPETSGLGKYIAEDLRSSHGSLKFSLDYHCCSMESGSGYILHPWGTSDTLGDGTIPEGDRTRFEDMGGYFKSVFQGYKYGTPNELVRYKANGSIMDYLYENYGTLAFSFEGVYSYEDKNFLKHAEFWDGIFQKVLSD
ncbi:MAG: succinylglutamate desuccinylase/aspartoacylase family protein [Oligoflexales bacterium]|nr:succinylglutamate desuccinylase/aspartoacylase family protein [Oligoflexales bacterium]